MVVQPSPQSNMLTIPERNPASVSSYSSLPTHSSLATVNLSCLCGFQIPISRELYNVWSLMTGFFHIAFYFQSSSILPYVSVLQCYWFLAPATSSSGKLVCILCIHLAPSFSGWQFVLWSQFSDGSKKVIFKFVELFSCCKDKDDNSQALCMSELNPEILGSFLL